MGAEEPEEGIDDRTEEEIIREYLDLLESDAEEVRRKAAKDLMHHIMWDYPDLDDQLFVTTIDGILGLLSDDDAMIRREAVNGLNHFLGTLRDIGIPLRDRIMARLLEAVLDEDESLRGSIIMCLNEISYDHREMGPKLQDMVTSRLLELTGDESGYIRRLAILVLGNGSGMIPEQRLEGVVVRLLEMTDDRTRDSGHVIREEALEALGRLGCREGAIPENLRGRVVERLLELSNDGEAGMRSMVCRTMGTLKEVIPAENLQDVLSILLELQDDDDGSMGSSAFRARQEIQESHPDLDTASGLGRTLDLCLDPEKDGAEGRRALICEMEKVGEGQRATVVKQVLERTRERRIEDVVRAVETLRDLKGLIPPRCLGGVLSRLTELLDDSREDVARVSTVSFAHLGDATSEDVLSEIRSTLLDLSKDENAGTRARAARCLGTIGRCSDPDTSDMVLERLRGLLADPAANVRAEAVDGLGQILGNAARRRSDYIVESILETTKDRDETVRKQALTTLWKGGDLILEGCRGTVVVRLLDLCDAEEMREDVGGCLYYLSHCWDLGDAIPQDQLYAVTALVHGLDAKGHLYYEKWMTVTKPTDNWSYPVVKESLLPRFSSLWSREGSLEGLLEMTNHPDTNLRLRAITRLGDVSGTLPMELRKAVVARLLELSKDDKVCRASVRALGRLGGAIAEEDRDAVVDRFLAVTDKGDEVLKREMVDNLRGLGRAIPEAKRPGVTERLLSCYGLTVRPRDWDEDDEGNREPASPGEYEPTSLTGMVELVPQDMLDTVVGRLLEYTTGEDDDLKAVAIGILENS